MEKLGSIHLQEPIAAHMRRDFTALQHDMTVRQAEAFIRQHGVGEQIIYFFVLDDEQRLMGVLPTRRLLTADLEQPLSQIMLTRVVTIPESATVLEACEFFVMHKFLAFPVVDRQRRLVGVIDINLFTDEVFDLVERERSDAVFEALGFRLTSLRDASPLKAFRVRFPWLLATIGSGTVCALLTSLYEATLARNLVLAFFLTLVLGLGESVSIQSMTVTIQILRGLQPGWRWYLSTLGRELRTAVYLGGSCGAVVGMIVYIWRADPLAGVVIGSGILLSLCAACLFGLSVPALLHVLRLDPKIAAGPITLALTDIFTLLFYFNLAAVML